MPPVAAQPHGRDVEGVRAAGHRLRPGIHAAWHRWLIVSVAPIGSRVRDTVDEVAHFHDVPVAGSHCARFAGYH
jgi:hypothetical protein